MRLLSYVLFFSLIFIFSNAYAIEYTKDQLIEKRKGDFKNQVNVPTPNLNNNSGSVPNDSNIESPANPNFYENKREGYYWYQDPKEREKQKEKEMPSPSKMSYDELWNMHPDDFKELLQVRLKEAIRNPTEENVLQHLQMQEIATNKATAFASVVALVGQKNPTLLNNPAFSTSIPGQRAQVKEAKKSLEDLIYESKNDFALIMFTKNGCSYCEEQKGITDYFKTAFDWEIRSIDIDENPEFASQFKIEITPTIIIVARETGEHMPVSAGVISVEEISQRVYRSIRYLKKEIQPEQYFMKSSNEYDSGNPLKKGF